MSLLKKASKMSSAIARRSSVGSLTKWQVPSLGGTEGSVATSGELVEAVVVVSLDFASA